MNSNTARATEAKRMMRAALSDFSVIDLFEAGDTVEHEATVFLGESETVSLRVEEPVSVGMHRRARRDMTVSVNYESPVPAPIAEGDAIAILVVEAPGIEPREYTLVAAEDVEQKGLMGRIGAALAHMIRG